MPSVLKVLGSTTLWLALLLLLLQPALCHIDPLSYLNYDRVHPFQQIQRSAAWKYQQLVSRAQAPDMLIIGSSVIMCPIYYWDCASHKAEFNAFKAMSDKLNINTMQTYNQANFWSSELSKYAGRHVDIYNMTIAACMVSDADLVTSRVIRTNKRPSVIVYGIFARDFSDNLIPPLGTTPVFKAVGDWRDALTLAPEIASDTIQELLIYSVCSYYRVRNNFEALIADATAKYLHHPRTLAEGTQMEANSQKVQAAALPGATAADSSITAKGSQAEARLALMTRDYYNRYNPPDKHRFQQEMRRFEHLLKECKQSGIKLIIVNMPLSTRGRAVIPDTTYYDYLSKVTSTCAEAGAQFVDLQKDHSYPDDDFIDIVHLNQNGAEKFQKQLLPVLQNAFHY